MNGRRSWVFITIIGTLNLCRGFLGRKDYISGIRPQVFVKMRSILEMRHIFDIPPGEKGGLAQYQWVTYPSFPA